MSGGIAVCSLLLLMVHGVSIYVYFFFTQLHAMVSTLILFFFILIFSVKVELSQHITVHAFTMCRKKKECLALALNTKSLKSANQPTAF